MLGRLSRKFLNTYGSKRWAGVIVKALTSSAHATLRKVVQIFPSALKRRYYPKLAQ